MIQLKVPSGPMSSSAFRAMSHRCTVLDRLGERLTIWDSQDGLESLCVEQHLGDV